MHGHRPASRARERERGFTLNRAPRRDRDRRAPRGDPHREPRPDPGQTRRKATEAQLAISATLSTSTFTEFRDYPPDGYDRDPLWGAATATCNATGPSGITLPTASGPALYSGSGCLVYFLCYPITNAAGGASGSRTVGPYLRTLRDESFSATFWDKSFSLAIAPSNPSYKPAWSACEILDADGLPIHYDRVKPRTDPGFATFFDANRFAGANGIAAHSDQTYLQQFAGVEAENDVCSALGDGSHVGASAPRHSDPRAKPVADGCVLDGPATGPWAVDGYDLWAHGRSFANARTAIH